MNKMMLANLIIKELCIITAVLVVYSLWGKEKWQKALSITFFIAIAIAFYKAGAMR